MFMGKRLFSRQSGRAIATGRSLARLVWLGGEGLI
jgi:hypothetical protein